MNKLKAIIRIIILGFIIFAGIFWSNQRVWLSQIIVAIECGNVEMVETFTTQDNLYNINGCGNYIYSMTGCEPLFVAENNCYKNRLKIVKLLLDRGAIPTREDFDDTLGSCSKESVEVGKLFIEYGYRPSISTLTSIAGKSPDVFRHPSESLEKAQRYITDIFSYTLKYAKLKDKQAALKKCLEFAESEDNKILVKYIKSVLSEEA